MKKVILFFTLFIIVASLNAQVVSDSIQTVKKIGTIFRMNGKNLSPSNMLKIMESNTEAYSVMKTANTNYTISIVFCSIGAFAVGYEIGSTFGGEPNWTIAAIGATAVVVAIPFGASYTKQAKKAVNIYNRGLRANYRNSPDMVLNFSPGRIGLKVNF